MKVLVVLEDPTLDQHVVRPVIEWIFEDLGRRARIEVLTDPHMRGVGDVLSTADDVIGDNPMVDVFVFVIDRDCDRERHTSRLRERLAGHAARAVGCVAIEEVEAWMLAAQEKLAVSWREIRAECDPKERYAEPWLQSQGYTGEDVGRGRKSAMRSATGAYRRILQRCDEVRALRDSLETIMAKP